MAIVVAALAVSEIGPPTSSARSSKEVVTAEQGVVQSTVTGSGNVAAGTDVTVNFNASGTLQDVYVKVGQHVNGGQLLADLDPTSANLQLSQAQLQLTSAEDQLTCVQDQTTANCGSSGSSGSGSSGSGSSGSSNTTSYTPSSSGTVEFASYKPGAGKNKKPTSGSGGTPTKSGTKVTKTTPSVTVTVVVPSTTRSSSSGGGSSAAKTSSTPTTTTTATPSPSSLASAQAAVYSAQAAVHTAETAVNDTKLYAPTSGTIASLSSLTPGDTVSSGGSSSASSSSSSSSGSSGTAATGGAATAGSLGGSSSSSSGSSSGFAEIVNTNTLTMTVAFSESDISKVKVGQPATVTLDALAGVELAAHISSISLVGTTSSSVVSYNATLTLDQNDSRVKPGMSASASVITGQASGVTVPNAAVTGSGSLGTVNLMKNGKEVSQQVVVGLRGDSRTKIISGVSAGDQLVITIALPSLSSTSTSGSSGSGTLGGGGLGGLGGGGLGGGGGGGFFRGGGGAALRGGG
ncbi:MAG TPA: HlyD family efflux transporter periplasmic adaptor subunit [Solirubrobacteraceae bacterium]